MKKSVVLLRLTWIVIFTLPAAACSPKETGKKAEQGEETNAVRDTIFETVLPDTMEVKIYRFFDDDGVMACEYNTALISRANMLADTKKILLRYPVITLKDLFYEGTRLIVDLDPSMEEVLDWGSTGSLAYTSAILYTFASYPGVTEIKVTIDGAEDIEGSHFSFKGVFPAEAYLNYPVIKNNDNIPPPESPEYQIEYQIEDKDAAA